MFKISTEDVKKNYLEYIIYAFFVAAFILCYYYTFSWLDYKYSRPTSYYSHGYMIPFVTFYLIYIKKEKLNKIEISSSGWGLVILVIALLLHIFGTMGDINFFSGFSMFFYILGCSLYLFGKKITEEIYFPLFFLIFMFPVPQSFLELLGLPSKRLATGIALKGVGFLGIPYLQEGFRIHLSRTTLVVGTPCNGMRSLISFLALALIYLHLMEFSNLKRILIVSLIYPMAIFLNGCRILILVFIANNYGIEKASPESYLHSMSGMFVFIVGIIFLLFFVRIVNGKKQS